ncbi:hypothetical protein AB0C96_15765 [Streptomyces sp. NPDC048506]|uniref:hypothetical protein n=1 Tax=Streptomyces sp. NPDC048506 TaxID=3155028 RepID=UPI0034372779
MFSRKTIATVSALLGSLAVTCAGASQAYAGEAWGDCTRGPQGDSSCIHKRQTTLTTKDGKRVLKQQQDCSSTARHHVVWPESGLLPSGGTQGPSVDCSNRAAMPKGFRIPHIGY